MTHAPSQTSFFSVPWPVLRVAQMKQFVSGKFFLSFNPKGHTYFFPGRDPCAAFDPEIATHHALQTPFFPKKDKSSPSQENEPYPLPFRLRPTMLFFFPFSPSFFGPVFP